MNFTAKIRKHLPSQAAGTVYYPMDVDDVPAAGGSPPDRLLDVSQVAVFQQVAFFVPGHPGRFFEPSITKSSW